VFLSRNPQTSRHTQQLPTRAFRQAPALRLHRHSLRVCRSQLGGGNIVRTRIKDPCPKWTRETFSAMCHSSLDISVSIRSENRYTNN
jgi:hypothetical protein